MSTVQEIKSAISELSVEDRARLVAELCGWTDDEWDREMTADADAGKFGVLNKKADTDRSLNKTLPLRKILGE